MKNKTRILAIWVTVCMLFSMMPMTAWANDNPNYNIPKAVNKPTLDGVMTDGEWEGALCMELTADNTYDVTGVMNSGSADYGTGKYYFMWDEDGMYVCCFINDTNQNFLFSGSEGRYNAYDGAQFCIYPNVDGSGFASGDLFFISAVRTSSGGFAISDHFSFDGNPQDLENSSGASTVADTYYVLEFCISATDLNAGNTKLAVADGTQFAMANIIMAYGNNSQGLITDSGWFNGANSNKYTFVSSIIAGGEEEFGDAVEGELHISEENFPDMVFRNYLRENIDTNKNYNLSDEEISAVTEIDVNGKGISSLKGIEYFTSLKTLSCYKNNLTTLDVSNNTALEYLNCYNNQLSELDVSKNTELTSLECSWNSISELIVSENTKLTYLECIKNQLTSLDVSRNTALTDLYCSGNELTSLNVSDNTGLINLSCAHNQLTSLDLQTNTALINLDCCHNELNSLDISKNTKLEWIDCDSTNISSIDVSNNKALTNLNCPNNKLKTLNVSSNEALTDLCCQNNQLTSLDVSKNTALTCLYCSENQLTELDISNNTKLEQLYCSDNLLNSITIGENTLPDLSYADLGTRTVQLTSSDFTVSDDKYVYGTHEFDSIPYSFSDTFTLRFGDGKSSVMVINYVVWDGDIKINAANFPDETFRNYVSNSIDSDKNLSLSLSEVQNVTNIDVGWYGIASLDGIEYFFNLKGLWCSNNQLATLDVNKNTALELLDCQSNQIAEINVSKNTALTYLNCCDNLFTTLDLSKNTALTSLYCMRNQLTSLDVSKNTALTSFYCSSNNLEYITVDDNQLENLSYVNLGTQSVQIASSKFTYSAEKGKYVYDGCEFDSIPASFSGTFTLNYGDGQSTSMTVNYVVWDGDIEINATNFPDKTFREYVENNIDTDTNGSLSFSEVQNVTYINVNGNWEDWQNGNGITSLKGIEYFSNLITLNCRYNQLTSLDLRNNTSLISLSCYCNKLTSLNVSKNTALTDLICSNNQLTSLDVSKNTALQFLNCQENQLSAINVSNSTALTFLNCCDNKLTSLDVSKNTLLQNIQCGDNQLKSITVDDNALQNMTYVDLGTQSVQIASSDFTASDDKYVYGTHKFDSMPFSFSDTFTLSYGDGNSADMTVNYVVWDGDIEINATNFSDKTFREYVENNIDTDTNGSLSFSEVQNVTYINVNGNWNDWQNGNGITSLKGIEYFSNLQTLHCRYNQLTTLDLSNNIALTYLNCYGNKLTSLNISKNTALIYLNCGYNQLTSLDVSKNTALTCLYCSENQLTKLDLSKNTALTNLDCGCNQLITLDVSNNVALTDISCGSNLLTAFDLSKNTALTYIYCYGNKLTSLDISNNTLLQSLICGDNQLKSITVDDNALQNMTYVDLGTQSIQLTSSQFTYSAEKEKYVYDGCEFDSIPASFSGTFTLNYGDGQSTSMTVNYVVWDGDIEINATNFPDKTFREYVENNIDTDTNGSLSFSEVQNVTYINVNGNWNDWKNGNGITSLKGIEYFSNLQTLHCQYNQLSALDLSNNTSLTYLNCYGNKLTSLNISKNTALIYLDCGYNQLTSLTVNNNKSLSGLFFGGNKITEIDVSNNTLLNSLGCEYNQISSLDVSHNTALTYLNCYSNELTSLDVSKNTALTNLSCGNNQLTKLDLSKNTALTNLDCECNQLITLDVSNNVALTDISCGSNLLTVLDISNNTALTSLSCCNNQLTSLDVSKNTELTYINCYDDKLTSLDISKNTLLQSLQCGDNQLKSITVGDNALQNMTYVDLGTQSIQIASSQFTYSAEKDKYVYDGREFDSIPASFSGTFTLNYGDDQSTSMTVNYVVWDGDIEINATNFPDKTFREYVENNIDTDTNGSLSFSEVQSVTNINVNGNWEDWQSGNGITSLKGIEYFSNLISLYCNYNQITELDVSNNTLLRQLWCNYNQLTLLDVSVNTVLEELLCENNKLTQLDVSNNTLLRQLWCHNNELIALDVSVNTALEELLCGNNKLTQLDVSNNTLLRQFWCYNNCLTTLDVSNNTSLTDLMCDNQNVTISKSAFTKNDDGEYVYGSQTFEDIPNDFIETYTIEYGDGLTASMTVCYTVSSAGDFDGDGKIAPSDLVRLRNYLANYDYSKGKCESVNINADADMNTDGVINLKDLVALRLALVSLGQ